MPEGSVSHSRRDLQAGFCSWSMMWWQSNLIETGFATSLEMHHIWPTARDDQHIPLYDQYWEHVAALQKESPNAEHPEEVPSGSAFYRLIGGDFWLSACLYAGFVITSLIMPYLLYRMVQHLEATSGWESKFYNGLILAFLLFMAQACGALCQGLSDMVAVRGALKMRAVLVTSVYRHALRLSAKGRSAINVGKMVNLMASDSTRFVEAQTFLNHHNNSFSRHFYPSTLESHTQPVPSLLSTPCTVVLTHCRF